ncbi:hypothetical protein DPV78_008574 [Talaromyces pinophilus]|nr:hypothetical protein DPV78_008574 [Talaromyces pinophilus]
MPGWADSEAAGWLPWCYVWSLSLVVTIFWSPVAIILLRAWRDSLLRTQPPTALRDKQQVQESERVDACDTR